MALTPYSWKIVTTANCSFAMPFECPPVGIWVDALTAKTATIEGIWGGGALPNDDEIWLETEYLADAGQVGGPATLTAVDNNGVITSGTILTVSSSSGGARAATAMRSSGKLYFEVTYTTVGSNSTGAGLTATGAVSQIITGTVVDALAIYKVTGNIWIDGANTGTALGAFTNGQVICYAIDLDNKKAWLRLGAAGNWNNAAIGSQDPANNIGGLSISGLPDACPAGYCAIAADVLTFNFGSAGFNGTVPSGFAAWAIPTIPASPRASIVSDSKADMLATAAAQTASGAVWGGGSLERSMPSETFAPSLLTGNGSLTNGNLTVNWGSSGAVGCSTIATYSSGKYYLEFTLSSPHPQGSSDSIGFKLASVTNSQGQTGGSVVGVFACNIPTPGNIRVDNVFSGFSLGNHVAGDVFCAAVDFTNRLFWYRRNAGNWNGNASANPATGAAGIAMSAGSYAPYLVYGAGGAARSITMNTGATAYAFTPPAGFGNLAPWVAFKLSTTFTPAQKGFIYCRVKCAKPSATFYVDPMVTIT